MSGYHFRPCSRTVRRLVLIGALPAGVPHSARDIQIARDRIAFGIASLVDSGYFKGKHQRPKNLEGWHEWLRLQASARSTAASGSKAVFGGL
jgi:hypothetical protein